jgi:hypothetical protein
LLDRAEFDLASTSIDKLLQPFYTSIQVDDPSVFQLDPITRLHALDANRLSKRIIIDWVRVPKFNKAGSEGHDGTKCKRR